MAGKGFTVKKNWDNPREHAMPAEARVPAEVRLGTVLVAPATVLAPMAGVTDTVFRRFIRHASSFTTGQNAGKIESGVQPCQGTTSQAAEKLDSEGAGGFNPRIKPEESTRALAPEAGPSVDAAVTNTQSGCGLLMTEFTSADGLARMR